MAASPGAVDPRGVVQRHEFGLAIRGGRAGEPRKPGQRGQWSQCGMGEITDHDGIDPRRRPGQGDVAAFGGRQDIAERAAQRRDERHELGTEDLAVRDVDDVVARGRVEPEDRAGGAAYGGERGAPARRWR
jgi:hypothetical protein